MDAILHNLIKATIVEATVAMRLGDKSTAMSNVAFLFGLLAGQPHNDPKVISLCYNGVRSMKGMTSIRCAFNLVSGELGKLAV